MQVVLPKNIKSAALLCLKYVLVGHCVHQKKVAFITKTFYISTTLKDAKTGGY
jgi:hypothetical protein